LYWFLFYFAVSLCATESLHYGHAIRKYRSFRSRTPVGGYPESGYPRGGSHSGAYSACWYCQPGGCGVAQPVSGAADAFYPGASGAGDGHPHFELPVQISLPVYSLERPANPQPMAYLVLQADSYRPTNSS
jgi:hypothetical protein